MVIGLYDYTTNAWIHQINIKDEQLNKLTTQINKT